MLGAFEECVFNGLVDAQRTTRTPLAPRATLSTPPRDTTLKDITTGPKAVLKTAALAKRGRTRLSQVLGHVQTINIDPFFQIHERLPRGGFLPKVNGELIILSLSDVIFTTPPRHRITDDILAPGFDG